MTTAPDTSLDDARPAPSGTRALLLVVVITAALHGWAMALVRPMFQVSDEIAYFTHAQHFAAAQAVDGAHLERILPGGERFYNQHGGKAAFGHVVGRLLALSTRSLSAPDGALVVRMVISLCHVVVVVAIWAAARRLYPADWEIAWLAAFLAALHPILTTFNAGLTPDAFANALSALSLYLVVETILARRETVAVVMLLCAAACGAAALSFKDTALCVLAAVALAGVARAVAYRRGFLLAGTLLGLAGIVGVVSLRVRSAYVDAALAGTTVTAATLATRVFDALSAMIRSLPGVFATFWTAFGNFGAHEMDVSALWLVGISAACLLAIWRVIQLPRRADGLVRQRRAAWVCFAAAGAVALLLHPLRSALLSSEDVYQGRWLFPVAVPIVLGLAVGLAGNGAPTRRRLLPWSAAIAFYGIGSLLVVVIPFFYESFPIRYETAHLYLQGAYGQNASPTRAMALVEPVSAWVVYGRVMLVVLVMTSVAGALGLVGRLSRTARSTAPGLVQASRAD